MDPVDNAAPPRDRWFALGVALAMVILPVVIWPFGHRKAPELSAFMPMLTSASIVAFALTASLLHAQYRSNRNASFAVLSLAYAAAAALLLPYVLTFPNVFSPSGLLGAGPQTAAWLHATWHILFCLIVLAYVAVERAGPARLSQGAVRAAALVVASIVVGITAVATLGQAYLPQILAHGSSTPLFRTALLPVIFGSMLAASAALIASTRLRTRRHLWLSVVLLALFVETFISAFESGGRFSYGWYFARAELAISSTALLMMLQVQYASIVRRVSLANQRLEARNAQIEAFIALQEKIAAALPSRDAVVGVILDFARHHTRAHSSVLEMPDGDEMVYEAATGTLLPYIGTRIKRAASLSGACATTREILLCENTATDPRVDRAASQRLGIGSMIVVPFAISPEVTAVLKVASSDAWAFGNAEVQTLQLAAKFLASGLSAAHEVALLEDSEHRYRVLTDAMPQIVGIVDRTLQLVYVNKSCWTYTGQSVDKINDTSAAWIVHRDDRHVATAARSAVDADAEFECELRLRRTDGLYRWHSLRAVPLKTLGAEPAQWIFTATDIEDRKQADAIIAESTARLARSAQNDRAEAMSLREANRLLVMAEQMARVGHYRVDLASNEASWSEEVYRTYGLPTTFTPTLDAMLSAYHADDRDRIIEIIDQTLADGRVFTFSSRIVRPDGTIRAVVAGGQAERTPDGKIVGLFGVLQDVTSIKETEREREKLSERVLVATKAGKIGIWEWNAGRDVLEWDGAMYALYGVEDATSIPAGDLWIRSIHPDDRARTTAEFERAVAGKAPFDTEFRVIWSTGELRHIRAIGTLLSNSIDGGSRMVGANWDITEVRNLADNLRDEKEHAEEASRAKSEFLARMSHEIRTPMNGIIGFTTLVLDGQLESEQRRYVMLLRDAGRSLLAIINDILDFSKLEAGRIELEHIPLNVEALVDSAVAIVRDEALPKGITLDNRIAADIPAWVNGDPTRLRQTLLNLLTNALKFTEHGSITVTVRRESAPHDDRIRFEIADTGIGIAPDQRHLLFADFSQLETSTTRQYGGTGLGLAICKRLVEAMGGAIGVQSEPGLGSLFWFNAELPEIATPALSPSDESAHPIAPLHILVAEDNRVNQIVVESLLARDGHTIVIVENGVEAVEASKSATFDLVLMDMQMPIMDGIEATRAIRALPAPACNVPIVALTANAMPEEVERCEIAGMNGHLAKPIDRELLRRAIARWSSDAHAATNRDPQVSRQGNRMQPNPTFTDTPTLGIATLLDIFDGDLASVGEIFDAALASIQVDFARIELSAAARDMETVVEAAHRMKGTSGSIRSQRIMQVSAAIQHAAQKHPQIVDPALLHELDEAVSEFCSDLAAQRGFLAATS